jgi:hypothetical protein
MNTMETRPISQKEYFVQEYIIQGITHTRAVIYCRDVLNKGRFVLAPNFLGNLAVLGNRNYLLQFQFRLMTSYGSSSGSGSGSGCLSNDYRSNFVA